MSARHTQGPWTAGDFGPASNRFPAVVPVHVGTIENRGNVIALVHLGGPGAIHPEQGCIEANARLIAAAPELLRACEQAAEWLEGWASAEPYIGVLRAAIAKATGSAS